MAVVAVVVVGVWAGEKRASCGTWLRMYSTPNSSNMGVCVLMTFQDSLTKDVRDKSRTKEATKQKWPVSSEVTVICLAIIWCRAI